MLGIPTREERARSRYYRKFLRNSGVEPFARPRHTVTALPLDRVNPATPEIKGKRQRVRTSAR